MNQKFKRLKQAFDNSYNIKSIIRKELVIQKYHEYACFSSNSGINQIESDVVVSLTTYSKRIFDVYLTIESLLQQSYKPKHLILWLSEEELTLKEVPESLLSQIERGLEIRFCEDIGSFKKLIPTLLLFPNSTVITADDDYIYPVDFIERLVKLNKKFPKSVCYYTGARISLDKNKDIEPYLKWKNDEREYTPSCLNFATGAGGILYPENCFHNDVTNKVLFRRYTPKADDVWFKAMTVLKEVKYVKVLLEKEFEDKFISLDDMQDIALYQYNVIKNNNDKQINAVFKAYGLFEKVVNHE